MSEILPNDELHANFNKQSVRKLSICKVQVNDSASFGIDNVHLKVTIYHLCTIRRLTGYFNLNSFIYKVIYVLAKFMYVN